MKTTGWQIPTQSQWTLYAGPLPLEGSGELSPWLYLHRVGTRGRLPLARFRSPEHLETFQIFMDKTFTEAHGEPEVER